MGRSLYLRPPLVYSLKAEQVDTNHLFAYLREARPVDEAFTVALALLERLDEEQQHAVMLGLLVRLGFTIEGE